MWGSMMKRYFEGIIVVFFNMLRFSILKIFHIKNFYFKPVTFFSPFTKIEIGKESSLKLSKFIRVRSGVKIKVREKGSIEIGERTFINHGCMITGYEEIKIGKNVKIGPNVLIYDHDHDYGIKKKIEKTVYKKNPVIIEDNVWIGSGVIILRGTVIGRGSVIAAGSTIKGVYPAESLIFQEKNTQVREI